MVINFKGGDMISCAECVQRLGWDNPTIRVGKYGMCGCDYCNKPSYYRDLEKREGTTEVIHRHSNMGKKEFDLLQRTVSKVEYLLSKQTKKQEDKPPF